ncbi:MAG: cobalt-precorrin-5B (C(1))-methyltransferase [Bacteroidetes bacterium]|nr:MAG: cobalt-precorrin-5B (C(1))-methyltransferase [Bacteroidota bacterium]
MVLVFGGTTEGKKVAGLLDAIGQSYIYSTRTENKLSLKGETIWGELDQAAMAAFYRQRKVRLIVDAGHPFALQLHRHIHQSARELDIPVIRYERQFPVLESSEQLRTFPGFPDMVRAILASPYKRILALTGVQTIAALEEIWRAKSCFFRILDTAESREKARNQGLSESRIISSTPRGDADELTALARELNIDLILSKESGSSGFFQTKTACAGRLGIPLWVVRRPDLPDFDFHVREGKDFLRLFLQLKKKQLRDPMKLKSGYTTGSCVTAAARACCLALAEGSFPEYCEINLPGGEKALFPIFDGKLQGNEASCLVIKDAGDDPDVTHAKEIGCRLLRRDKPGIHFLQGEGVGRVSLPGLGLEVGEPAINPVPRRMISGMLEECAAAHDLEGGFEVSPFVPEGRVLARQTFNPRVGVKDGISIIGTSGRVLPYSHEAFIASIRQQINVARQMGCDELLFSSGKRGELAVASRFPGLVEQARIHYGNLIGETLKMTAKAGIRRVALSLMFGKAVKLAEGHLDTHSKKSSFNPEFLATLAMESGHPQSVADRIRKATLANAIPAIIPFATTEAFYLNIARACMRSCLKVYPSDASLKLFLVVGSEGIISIDQKALRML